MIPRHNPRTLYEQAQWRILRRRARLTGKTIEELLEEDRRHVRDDGLTIEPAAVPPTALSAADIETLVRVLVPAIAREVRAPAPPPAGYEDAVPDEPVVIEDSAAPSPAETADFETLAGRLVPAISREVRGGLVQELTQVLERISRDASRDTGNYIAQEVARRLATQVRAAPEAPAAAPAAAPPAPGEPAPERPRVAIGDIQSLIDMLNRPRPPGR